MSIKIRTRLILLAAIPAVALLYFAITDFMEKATLVKEIDQLHTLVNVSTKVGSLVHELQKERAFSSGFLSSKGTTYVNEMALQRSEVDKKSATLIHALKTLNTQYYGNELKAVLSEAEASRQKLDAHRATLSELGMTPIESAAYYIKIIAHYLKIPASIATLSSNGEISRLASTYTMLLEAKERAGKERAILTPVFTADKFTPGALNAFLANKSEQDLYINEFMHYATRDQKAFFTAKVTGASVDAVAQIKATAMQRTNEATLGVDPASWITLSTQRINLLKEVEDKLSADLIAAMQSLSSVAKRSMTWSITLTVLSLLATGVTTWYLSRNILRQLGGEPEYAVNILQEIAKGNLAVAIDIPSTDRNSLLASVQIMKQQLANTIADVRSSALALASASEEVSATSQNLSKAASIQASSVEETSASIEEISVSITQNSDNAKITHEMADKSAKDAVSGGKAVSETVQAMQKIAEKISLIDEVAYQTNLLALNAAIEAGRAGEHGRGFAVVASEVRKLAARSQFAAQEISHLVLDSLNLADRAGALLGSMVPSIERTAELTQGIATASNQQSTGMQHINTAIEQINHAMQQNAAASEQLTSTAEEMFSQASNLQQLMGLFNLEQAVAVHSH